MSTQALENQPAHATATSPEPVRAAKSYEFRLEIYPEEKFKQLYATVRWTLDPNYAIGSRDMIHLKDQGRLVAEMRPVASQQTWNTDQTFRSGLSASYVAWNYVTDHASEHELVVTPRT